MVDGSRDMPEEVPLPEGVRPLLEEGSVALLVPPAVPVLPLFMSVLRRAGSAAVLLRPVLVPAFGAGALRVVLLSVRLGVPASTGGVAVDPVVPDGAVPEVCATAMPPASDTQVAAIVANRKYVLLMLFLQKTLMTRLPPRRRSANTVLSMGNACAREVSTLAGVRPGRGCTKTIRIFTCSGSGAACATSKCSDNQRVFATVPGSEVPVFTP